MSERMYLERVWLIECRRCANSDYSDMEGLAGAYAEFTRMGWAEQFCPACNGVRR